MNKRLTDSDQLRKAWRDYWRGYREHTSSPDWPRNGAYPPIPPTFAGLTCGAKTRAGTPCKRIDLYWSGRCKFHGGLSTGPTSDKGKAQARDNGKLGGRGRIHKPNPMDMLRFCHGSDDAQVGSAPIAKTDAGEPNPLDGYQKLTVHAEKTGMPTGTDNLIKPDILSTMNGNVSVRVQCKECACLSVGFKCLSTGSGQSAPALGEWRECGLFQPLPPR